MGPGQQGPRPDEEKEEGQAEAAPPSTQQEPTLQPVPYYPGQKEREIQFVELHGYIRGRYDYFHRFNLGFKETTFSPFPTPICSRTPSGNIAPGATQPGLCPPSDLEGANMRLRFDPTLNVSEHVRVRAQIDLLDNLVLGSTPDSWASGQAAPGNAPLGALSTTQVPPSAGRNSFSDSVAVKRAWGEVRLPFGELKFGRMPTHWGLGIFANDGNCLDCDYGSTADRVLFTTRLYDHLVGFGYGWVASGITSTQTATATSRYFGQGFPLDRKWGVGEWVVLLGRLDKPDVFKERVQRGEVAINYGTYHLFRSQENDIAFSAHPTLGISDKPGDSGGLRDVYVKRGAFAWVPDIFFQLSYRGLDVAFEGVYVLGKIDHAEDINPRLDRGLNIRQWGVVLRSQYRFLSDSLRVGLEIGSASGDSSENTNIGYLDFRGEFNPPSIGSNVLGRFNFSPDYHVDEILWRRIYGAVSNATYFKPWIAYDIIEGFGGRLDLIHSLANRPVATPGNAINYGLELDASIRYHNPDEGFFTGITYAVLFPFGALEHPASKGDDTFWGTTYKGDAKTAQAVRLFVGISF